MNPRPSLLLRLNPAVPRRVLTSLAGLIWCGVGVMLMIRAAIWLLAAPTLPAAIALGAGLLMTGLMLPGVFLKVTRRNLDRLARRPERACLFSFLPWRSWLIAVVMSAGGILLRQSPTPRLLLATPYLGMGLCLLAGGLLHLLVSLKVLKHPI